MFCAQIACVDLLCCVVAFVVVVGNLLMDNFCFFTLCKFETQFDFVFDALCVNLILSFNTFTH